MDYTADFDIVSPGAIQLYLRVHSLAQETGYSFAGLDRLAAYIKRARRTAQGYITELRRARWIETQTDGRHFFVRPLRPVESIPAPAAPAPRRPFSSVPAAPLVACPVAPLPASRYKRKTSDDAPIPDRQQTDTDTKAIVDRVVVSKEGETAREAVSDTAEAAIVAEVAALASAVAATASIPATEAARAVKLDSARARNAAAVVKATKQPGNPLSLFWASFHRGWTPNPTPDPKPARIATEGAKTVVYRQDHSGALTGPLCPAAQRAQERAQEFQQRGVVRA